MPRKGPTYDARDLCQARKRLLALFETVCARGSTSYWDAFAKLLQIYQEALDHLCRVDLAWEPDLGDWTKSREEIAEMLGIWLAQVHPEPTYQDLLGSLYMDAGHGKKGFAQFFTPWNVASMMAHMTIQEPDLGRFTPQEPMTVLDPACGSGIMLLAAAAALPAEFVAAGRVHLTGIDIDPICAQMCRLNLRLYGLRHRVECRNALLLTAEESEALAKERHREEVRRKLALLDRNTIAASAFDPTAPVPAADLEGELTQASMFAEDVA